jgi:outer membrane protein assembly factor BamB
VNATNGAVENKYYLNYRDPSIGTTDSFRNTKSPDQEPVLANRGVFYYPGYRGIYAARQSDGALLWEHYISSVPFNDVYLETIIGNTIYAQSGDTLYALRTSDGELLWQHNIAADITIKDFSINTISIVGNVLYGEISYQNPVKKALKSFIVYVLNAQNGSYLWQHLLTSQSQRSDLQLTNSHDVIYAAVDTTLYAYSMRDGLLLWHRKGVDPISSIAVSSGLILICDANNVFALHESDHSFAWIVQRKITKDFYGATNASLSVDNGDVYFDLSAFRISGGQPLWSYPANTGKLLFTRYGNRLVFSFSDATWPPAQCHPSCFSLDARDRYTGSIVWQQDVYNNLGYIDSSIYIVNDLILVDDSGLMSAFIANTGQFLWVKNYVLSIRKVLNQPGYTLSVLGTSDS